jgi:hypothetical protein
MGTSVYNVIYGHKLHKTLSQQPPDYISVARTHQLADDEHVRIKRHLHRLHGQAQPRARVRTRGQQHLFQGAVFQQSAPYLKHMIKMFSDANKYYYSKSFFVGLFDIKQNSLQSTKYLGPDTTVL